MFELRDRYEGFRARLERQRRGASFQLTFPSAKGTGDGAALFLLEVRLQPNEMHMTESKINARWQFHFSCCLYNVL